MLSKVEFIGSSGSLMIQLHQSIDAFTLHLTSQLLILLKAQPCAAFFHPTH
jgi:hypothetical protein